MTLTNTVVVAGAGTGKTHALVERYLGTLLGLDDDEEPRSPEQVLAITFTEKAASEMRARVQRRLGDLVFAPEKEAALLERARARGRDVDTPAWRALVEGLRRSVSGAPIHTFHAFCARVLRDHALACDLDPSFAILEPDDERRLLQENAEATVLDALQRGSPEVAELVARVALHGFGERNGLVECLVDLHGTLAERGLDAAALHLAADDSEDVDAALARFDGTLDALRALASPAALARCAFVAQAKGALAAAWATRGDVQKDPEVRIAGAFTELRGHVGGNWGGNKVTAQRQALVVAADAVGAALIDAFTRDLAPVVRELLSELDVRQRREKHARGFLAFGDLLAQVRGLLGGNPSVRARVKGRFARVLVDEYQDTSPVQEDVLALLIEEPAHGAVVRFERGVRALPTVTLAAGRAFLVGDPKQSIYGFRGADAGVFTRALDVVAAAPHGARAELAVSRRSTAPLVDLANLVADIALPRGSTGVDRSQIVPLTSLRGGVGPAGEHWRAAPVAEDAPRLTPHETEALVIAQRLHEKIQAGVHAAGDVAILVRRGKAAVPIARALGRFGIPSVVVGGDGFYLRPEINDVIAALTLAADPADELAVLTVLRSPLIAVPDDTILALYEVLPGKRGLTWPEALKGAATAGIAQDVRERLRAFDSVLATVKKRLHEPALERTGIARAIDALLDDGGYAAACAVERDAELRLRNLEKLRAMVELVRESSLVTLARLGAALDDPPPEPMAAAFAEAEESRAVRIMTIHQAKGLEFPVVVLADAGSGLKGESDDVAFDAEVGLAVTARGRPIAACAQKSKASAAPTAIQRVRRKLRERNECELTRLLYVAITRARDTLYVVGVPRRGGWGSLLGALEQVRANDTPRFDTLLPRIDVVAAAPAAVAVVSDPALAEPLPVLPALPAGRPRVRASDLKDALVPQLGLVLPRAERPSGVDEEERLPPRVAGRLGHAVVALVASEMRALIDAVAPDREEVRVAVVEAARALGVPQVPPALVERCVQTLCGPVRALVADGASLSFEEPLWLERDSGVVEGRADLVARTDVRTLVVEWKLSDATARSDTALLQVSAYAAAVETIEPGRPIEVAVWVLGDEAPAAPLPYGRALKNRLDKALAALK